MISTASTTSRLSAKLSFRRSLAFVLIAVFAGASTWVYTDLILKPVQLAEARTHGRPRGNLSDLYPRWLGARELLLHRRNPYRRDVTLEIQQGYYGRELDASRPYDPKDQQAFAYPVYVVFLLAPLVALPFSTVQILFHWLLIALVAATVPLWLGVLGWRLPALSQLACMALLLGCFPAVQGIKLQQLTLLVAALLAGSLFCMVRGWLVASGVLLACASIKPQLVWPLTIWLVVCALADWKLRRRFLIAFGITMAVFFAAAQIVLPGWLWMFLHAIGEYRAYTQSTSVLDELVNWGLGPYGGGALAALGVGLTAWVLWGARKAAWMENFGALAALVLALTILIVPMYAPYNQVLLIPAVLYLWKERRWLLGSPFRQILFIFAAFVLVWPWIATIALSLALLWSPDRVYPLWRLPLYSTFAVPVLVFVLTVWINQNHHPALRASESTE